MNILQLVPKLDIGGVEKGTVEVARHLTLNGHKAVVASGGGVFEKDLAAMGARHYSLPVGSKNPVVMLYSYFKLKHIIKKENILVVHARSRVPALTGYFAARATSRVFITTAHGQYRKHLMSKVMGWGKVVIVANETMARHMRENFGVPLRKITIIPRGVDLKKFSFISPLERKSKVFRIGMICRFTPLKGHLDFLKAASYISRRRCNLEVILMGDRSGAKEEYIKKIELNIRRLMIDKIVKFTDSTNDVADVMANLDVLVSANRQQEAFGRTVIEAQARGVPVVATNVGGVAENIIDGETGLLCQAMNPSSMADKIMRYMDDVSFMEEVALNARKYVEEHYSLEHMMALTVDAYSEAINTRNILVFKISSLGDVILSTPSLSAIRKRFPNATIKLLVDVRFREVFDNCPYIDEIITCDLAGRDRGIGFLRLAGKLRSEDFDMSVDLQNSRRTHLLAFLSAVPERYGYRNAKLSFLLNRRLNLPQKPLGPVEHQGCVLGLLGITNIENKLKLWPKKEDKAWAEDFLRNSWLKDKQKLVAFSLSASRRWQTKNWGLAPLAELADMLASRKAIRVVLLGSAEDRDEVLEFMQKTSAKPIDAVGKTNISQLTSLIERCDALLTGDSAPMHIAAATNTPFVAIFGPTDPRRHIGPAANYKVLNKKMQCAPCYKPTCSKGMKCMRSIGPEEAFNALMEIIDR